MKTLFSFSLPLSLLIVPYGYMLLLEKASTALLMPTPDKLTHLPPFRPRALVSDYELPSRQAVDLIIFALAPLGSNEMCE